MSEYDDNRRPGDIRFSSETNKVVTMTIENQHPTDCLVLHKCEMLRRMKVFSLTDDTNVTKSWLEKSCLIEPGMYLGYLVPTDGEKSGKN